MARKVFLSFLGTGSYEPTRYYLGGCDNFVETRFVQEAILQLVCKEFNQDDAAFLFLTDQARGKNWAPIARQSQTGYDGLEIRLKEKKFPFACKPIRISEGKDENEIWEIFEAVFAVLEEGDEVYFDITHAFRYLPMLVMVLINYAKFLKNIKVASITYGNWEGRETCNEKEYAPITELTALSSLQDWTIAANNFVNFGNADLLTKLGVSVINPVLKATRGTNTTAGNLKTLLKIVDNFTKKVQTNRGMDLYEGKEASYILTFINKVKDNDMIRPLNPLLNKIKERIDGLAGDDYILNGLEAVKWCLDSRLIQQGYSLLNETVISYILIKLSSPCSFACISEVLKDAKKRELVASAITIRQRKITKDQWSENARRNEDFVEKIINSGLPDQLFKEFSSLSEFRNDIMHAGFRDNTKSAKTLIDRLEKSYLAIRECILLL